MDVAVAKNTGKPTGASRVCPRTVKSSSRSFSSSSCRLSGHVGVRVLMHRDMITSRFFQSLPRSWVKKYWSRLGKDTDKSSASPLHWSSSPFSVSPPRLSSHSSSIRSRLLRSPVSRLSFPALKDRDREKDQAGTATSQALDGRRPSVPGMTLGLCGPSTSAAQSTSSTLVPACSAGHGLRHNSSSV